jgi:hypothetical protein
MGRNIAMHKTANNPENKFNDKVTNDRRDPLNDIDGTATSISVSHKGMKTLRADPNPRRWLSRC